MHLGSPASTAAPATPAASAASSATGASFVAAAMGGATVMASRKAHKAKASRQRPIVYAQKDLTESGLAQLVASVQEMRQLPPV